MMQFAIRKLIITFMIFIVFMLFVPACYALEDDGASLEDLSVGITIGEDGKHCFFYSEPNDNIDNVVGFYYPGSQVYILDRSNEWYHIYYEVDGYMKAEDLSVLNGVNQIQTIGYVFSSFDGNDLDVEPDDFIEFRVDCDLGKPGDAIGSGEAFELIGYAGEMLQVRRGAFNGFIPTNKAYVITFHDLFSTEESPKIYGPGSYLSGTSIPSGLFQVTATETVGMLILLKETGERISYELEDVAGAYYSVFIPKQANVYIPWGCCLSQVTRRQQERDFLKEGRYLCGVDFAGLPNCCYEVTANDTEGAYYIISNLFEDQTMDEGTIFSLLPGESRILYIFPGEYIETHCCIVEVKQVPG